MASAFSLLLIFFDLIFIEYCKAVDMNQLSFSESMSKGESLVLLNQRFEPGFFSPSSTNNKSYLGIWYKNYPDIVAWVANRESPLSDSDGTLTISRYGNLVLLNSSNSIIWSSNISLPSVQLQTSSVVHLLGSDNLVLTQNHSSVPEESYYWQSFDYPGDTLLPGMKIGWDWTTGKARKLTSWVDTTDPSPRNFVTIEELKLLVTMFQEDFIKQHILFASQ